MSLDEITRARLERLDSCLDIQPTDLLRWALDDIERGETTCDGLIVIWCRRPQEGNWDAGTYRAGLSRDQELVQLRLAEERLLRRWLVGEDA
jgi:hypothetical protein